MTTFVFCGPTITGGEVRAEIPDAVVRPPVRHGDLLPLGARRGDTVVLIDGLFHQSAAVRHKEILAVLAEGVRVIGASSMGALRAAELDRHGMTGVGRVYGMYRDGVTESDADVAVMHTENPEPVLLSVAMVDVLALAADALTAGAVTDGEHDAIVDEMRSRHYTRRSWRHLSSPGSRVGPETAARFRDWHAASGARGAKHDDALLALRYAAAAHEDAELPWTREHWRSEYTRDWQARFGGRTVDGRHVPFLAEIQYLQIFDPGFASRLRRRVLSWIAGLPADHDLTDAALTERALRGAADRGHELIAYTTEQRRTWLTPREDGDLTADEALLRILTRAVRVDATVAFWPATRAEAADLLGDVDPGPLVAHAFAVNDRARAHGIEVHKLDTTMVDTYLRRLWKLTDSDPAERTAAARDRGLGDHDSAVGVCRQFILGVLGDKLWRHLEG